jgi:hypothetical protein
LLQPARATAGKMDDVLAAILFSASQCLMLRLRLDAGSDARRAFHGRGGARGALDGEWATWFYERFGCGGRSLLESVAASFVCMYQTMHGMFSAADCPAISYGFCTVRLMCWMRLYLPEPHGPRQRYSGSGRSDFGPPPRGVPVTPAQWPVPVMPNE